MFRIDCLLRMMRGITSTGSQVEGLFKGYGGRPALPGLSSPATSGESGVPGANGAGTIMAVDNVHELQALDGGGIRVHVSDPDEQRGRVRHLVIFPAPIVGYARPVAGGA